MAIRMPFGKYKGKALDNVPRDYLEWILVGTRDPINPYLAEAIQRILARYDAQSPNQKKAREAKERLQGLNQKPLPHQTKKKSRNKSGGEDIQAWLYLPENAGDYRIALETGNVQEMAAASDRIRQRWESYK